MEKLKPCPFCGGKAVLKEKVVMTFGHRLAKDEALIPEGAVVVDRYPTHSGKEKIRWEKYGYAVHCTGTKCFCRSNTVKFHNKEDAVKQWNSRI